MLTLFNVNVYPKNKNDKQRESETFNYVNAFIHVP